MLKIQFDQFVGEGFDELGAFVMVIAEPKRESSTINNALYLSAKSQMPGRFAMMPSMEKTPSVAIILKRQPAASFNF